MPDDRPTLSVLAVRLLRERIASGQLPPGSRLSDLALAKEIGISRTPIREAIRLLAADGLVEISPHIGATVRTPRPAELDELYEIRWLLESHAARTAARRIGSADADALLALCAEMEALPAPAEAEAPLDPADSASQRRIDLEFHRRILALCGIVRLQRLVEDAGVITRPFECMDGPLLGREFRDACRQHRLIAEAIAARDGEAAHQAMAAHIQHGRDGLRSRLAAWSGPADASVPPALRPFITAADVPGSR